MRRPAGPGRLPGRGPAVRRSLGADRLLRRAPGAPVHRRRAARLACCPSAARDVARRSSRLSACRTARCSPAQRRLAGACGSSPRALLGARGGAPLDTELHVRPTRLTQADRDRLLRRGVRACTPGRSGSPRARNAGLGCSRTVPCTWGDARVSAFPSSAVRSPPSSGAVFTPARWRPPVPDEPAHPGSALRPLFRTLTEPITVESRTGAGTLRERDWWRASPR